MVRDATSGIGGGVRKVWECQFNETLWGNKKILLVFRWERVVIPDQMAFEIEQILLGHLRVVEPGCGNAERELQTQR